MTKVVAAIDNSAAARPVLATALAVAGLLRAELEAVHVREDGDRTARLAANAAGIPLRTLEGPEVDTLIREGEEDSVSAVVAGARGTPSGRRPAGHVALGLIQALQKPVAVVPPQATAPPRLARFLIPLDGTGLTADALRQTIELAHDSSIEVIVLHVLTAASLPAFSDQPQHEVEAWAREFLARYCPRPKAARLEMRVGAADELVLQVAEQQHVDLIALGWSRKLSLGRAQVVHRVLEHSDVPVLLVPVRLPSGLRADHGFPPGLIRAATDDRPGSGGDDDRTGGKEDSMIGEIAVIPQAEGPGREIVAAAVAEIASAGLRYEVGPAGTSIEGDLAAILETVRAIESRLRAQGVRRAVIDLRLQLEPHAETLEHQVEGIDRRSSALRARAPLEIEEESVLIHEP